jgi:hypothetical protein
MNNIAPDDAAQQCHTPGEESHCAPFPRVMAIERPKRTVLHASKLARPPAVDPQPVSPTPTTEWYK